MVDGNPMLFLPPQQPFALPVRGTVVLGRSRSCDLTLKTPDASRRHAEIVCGEEGWLLRDLGSTNGTFLNGERVDEREIVPGDRIEIGGDLVSFCLVDPALDTAVAPAVDQAQTVLRERPALGECVTGDLAEIPTYAVLQMLELGVKSGVLELDTAEGTGRLWLAQGAPIHALTKSQCGFDAAIAVANAVTGRFRFDPDGDLPERTIEASMTELLLEASLHLDENG
jgi:pSer/pThr/pTyr-binding forkhead associated (FHA) protein